MDPLKQLRTSLADRYEIDREIGAGGMATVYLARDPRHDRHVAIKVLNPELGAVLGVERFLAEIKVTANLQHPNLLPLFDSGEAGGLLFYVMPFVEGESLRARLEREKQLPVDEALRIAVAVANALDYAHGHHVIHRDLKPENILLQHGQPVVADFGIALAVSNAGGNRITQTGLSLGTPQYMSPEQATGDRVIDGRSDIYSLAALTYEMLTGEPPHMGSTAQAVIARVLTDRPRPIRTSRSAVPEHVEAALERALEKLPADRFSTAHEFADALLGRGATTSAAGTAARTAALPAPPPGWRARLKDPVVIALALVAVASVAALAVTGGRDTAPPLKPIRFIVATPDSAPPFANFPWPAAISPDGGMVVYSAATGRQDQSGLLLLRTDQVEAQPIPGTVGAHQALFSPDGQWLAFEQGTKQMKVRLDGGTPVAITDGIGSNGVDWTTSDELVLGAAGSFHGLSHVSASGGELVEFTHPDTTTGERDHLWPIAHPDGETVAFVVWTGSLVSSQLAITTLGTGEITPLGLKGIRPLAFLDDMLVYLQADGSVMAVGVDGNKVSGRPIPVHDRVQVIAGNNGNSGIFISRGGALVVAAGELKNQLAWTDRNGARQLVTSQALGFSSPRLSPDGMHIAAIVSEDGRSDVWTFDIATSTLSRLTSVGAVTYVEWTANSRQIVYGAAGANSRSGFWRQLAAGGAPAELLFESTDLAFTGTVSPDGSGLIVQSLRENTFDLMHVRLDSARVQSPFVVSRAQETAPAFSPDGRWVAYSSDESGGFEVYVRSYPNPSTKVQVSLGGGQSPAWAADGSRIYYQRGGVIFEAMVSRAPAFRVLARDTAFAAATGTAGAFGVEYAVPRDGRRILSVLANSRDFKLTVVPNWITEFRERVRPATRR